MVLTKVSEVGTHNASLDNFGMSLPCEPTLFGVWDLPEFCCRRAAPKSLPTQLDPGRHKVMKPGTLDGHFIQFDPSVWQQNTRQVLGWYNIMVKSTILPTSYQHLSTALPSNCPSTVLLLQVITSPAVDASLPGESALFIGTHPPSRAKPKTATRIREHSDNTECTWCMWYMRSSECQFNKAPKEFLQLTLYIFMASLSNRCWSGEWPAVHILETRLILSVFNVYFHVCYTRCLRNHLADRSHCFVFLISSHSWIWTYDVPITLLHKS